MDRVRSQFNYGLNVIDAAISGTAVPPPPSYTYVATPAPAPVPAAPAQKPADEMSFKEILERFAEEHGLLLVPTKKRYEGKQVYNFGTVPVYFEQQMLYRQLKTMAWVPTGLQELIPLQNTDIGDMD